MKMPFGKHKGEHVDNLPLDYLRWLTTINLKPRLKQEVERVLREHPGEDDYLDAEINNPGVLTEISVNIEQLRQRVLHSLHPDAGGNPDAFKDAYSIFRRLRELLNELGVVNG